jgi:imidazolonepropionase-like amidohydrolase
VAADPAAATAAVTAQADAGYDFVKVYTNLSPEAYRAAAAAARARRLPFTGHVPRRVELAEAAAAQASIEHLADYGEAIDARPQAARPRWHWSHLWLGMPADEARMRALAEALAQSGVRAVPTLAESERSLGTPEQIASWSALADMASMHAEGMALWRERVTRASARLEADDWALVERGRRNRYALVAALRAARVPILAGTDTPNAFLVPGASLHDELALLVAAGLSPGEALLAATREPARFLARAGATGTIAPGSRADLLLLSADPLADIGNTRRIAGVMAGGRWYGSAPVEAMRCALNSGCRR